MFQPSFNYSAPISLNNPLLFSLQWQLLQFSNTAQVNFSVGFTQTRSDCMLTKLQGFPSSSLIFIRAQFSVLLQFKWTIVMYATSRISFYKLSAGFPCSVSFLEKTLERWWNHKMKKVWTLSLCVNKMMPPKQSMAAGSNQGKSHWGLTYFVAAVFLALMNSEQVCGLSGWRTPALSFPYSAWEGGKSLETKIYVGLSRQRHG